MIMTISNIRRMSESSEVEGEGTAVATAAGSTDSSAVVSLIEKGKGDATLENSTLSHFRACSHLRSPLPKKGGTYRSDNMNRLRHRKLIQNLDVTKFGE